MHLECGTCNYVACLEGSNLQNLSFFLGFQFSHIFLNRFKHNDLILLLADACLDCLICFVLCFGWFRFPFGQLRLSALIMVGSKAFCRHRALGHFSLFLHGIGVSIRK